jgi:hypothetical protein
MLVGLAVIVASMGAFMIYERLYPARPLKHVPYW